MSIIPRDFLPTEDLFAPFFRGALWPTQESARGLSRGIAVDVTEDKNHFMVQADVPGVKKDDIQVTVHDDVLRLSVETTEEKTEEDPEKRWHRYERSGTWAARSIRLPKNADLDHIKAKYADGVLNLEIPKKKAEEESRRITIG